MADSVLRFFHPRSALGAVLSLGLAACSGAEEASVLDNVQVSGNVRALKSSSPEIHGCRFGERIRPVGIELQAREQTLVVEARNPSSVAGSATFEIHGQVERSELGPVVYSSRLPASGTARLRIPLEKLGVQPGDMAARFGVVVRTSYDDGVVDSGYDGGLYVERSRPGWIQAVPASDRTVMARADAIPPPGAEEIASVPFTKQQLLDRLRVAGIPLSDHALRVRTIDSSVDATEVQLAAAAPLATINVNFCFKQKNLFDDSGVGEDVWPETTLTARPAMGLYVTLEPASGQPLYFLLNSSGCTGTLAITAGLVWRAVVSSVGVMQRYVEASYCVDGNGDVPANDCDGPSSPATYRFSLGTISTSGTKTFTYWPTYWPVFQLAALGLFAVNRNPGTAAGLEYRFKANAPSSKSGYYTRIGTGGSSRKWLIGHEMGHRFFDLNSPDVPWSWINDYSTADKDPDCYSNRTDHGFGSKEYAGSALAESLGSFYAVLTFNNVSAGADCWFENGADCEEGTGAFQLAWMENRCPGSLPDSPLMPGMGTEVDWLRVLWNVRTGGTATVGMSTITSWVNWGWGWITRENAYSVLDVAADQMGGTLNANWDSAKVANGIDHPWDH